MISKDWETFNKNVKIKNLKVSLYEDDEGNYMILPTSSLLANVQYAELNKQDLQTAKFQMKIPKDMELNQVKSKTFKLKYDRTHKEADKNIIEEVEQVVSQVWFIADGLQHSTAYNNKEEALKKAKDFNKKILDLKE